MITIIHGGHREGLCFEAYNIFKDFIDKKKLEVKFFSLRDYDINFCCGDQPCQSSGVCIHKDTVSNDIIPVIANSDAILFFTPTYFNLPPAMLKNFMDRCNFLLTIKDRKHPNFGAWVSGTEKDSPEDNYMCLATFANIFEWKPLENGGIIRIEPDIITKQLSQDDLCKLQNLAKKVCERTLRRK